MRELLATIVVGFASALVPLINIEAFLGVRASVADVDAAWPLALAAATGQIGGKLVWYYLGASALDWGWVRRRVAGPSNAERLERWRRRTRERPVLAGILMFVSAFTGLPPFAALSVVAGQLRISLLLFCGLGLAGRWLRFLTILTGASWLGDLFS
jgi:membrane protein YqaA with SNARE-associated domain